MARPYEISLVSNTRELNSALRKSGDAVDGISDSLDDMGRDGDDTGEKLEASFKDAARAAERAGDDIGRSADDGFDRAKRGAEEFKDEANSTAREAAASFDGSMESAADAIQEVAANAFAGFGPAGAVAGLAAASGLGVVLTAIQDQQEAVEELKERFAEAYQAAAEEGRTFLDEAQIQAAAIDILFDQGKRKSAAEEARTIGVDVLTLVRAQAGDQEALNLVIEQTTQKEQERKDKILETNGVQGNRLAIADSELGKLEQIRGKYEDQLGIQRDNQRAAQDVLTLQDQAAAKEAANTSQAKKGYDERWAKLDAYYKKAASPPTVSVPVRADTSAFDAEMERIRRTRYQATGEVTWQHRGRTTVD